MPEELNDDEGGEEETANIHHHRRKILVQDWMVFSTTNCFPYFILIFHALPGIYVRFTQILAGYGCTRAELPDCDGHVIDRYAETMFLKKYGLGGLFHGSKTPWPEAWGPECALRQKPGC
jgi:hypothetical protein